MKKINILIVASYLWIGGAESIIANLCRRIDRDKFRVWVVCLSDLGDTGEKLVDEGFNVFSLPLPGTEKTKYFTFLQLFTLVKMYNINLLHSHTTQSLIDTSICRLFNRRIKVVHTFHYGNYPYYNKKYLRLEKIFCREFCTCWSSRVLTEDFLMKKLDDPPNIGLKN